MRADKKPAFISVCLLIFIDSIGAGLIAPIMPELFFNHQYGLVSTHPLYSAQLFYGIALALFPLAGFFSMPIMGALSDSYGRKRVMVIGLLGIITSYLVTMLSILLHDIYLFLIARFMIGVFAGSYVVANAVIGEMGNTLKTKAKYFNRVMLVSIAGFILGPLFGGSSALLEGVYSLLIPFAIVTALSMLNLIMMLYRFPTDSLEHAEVKTWSKLKVNLGACLHIFHQKRLRLLNLSYCFLQFAWGLYMQFLSLLLADLYHFDTGELAMFFMVMALGPVINVVLIQKIMNRWFSVKKTVPLYGVIMTLLFLLQGAGMLLMVESSRLLTWVSTFLIVVLMPATINALMAIFSQSTPSNQQGLVMGGVGQLFSLTWFIAGLSIALIPKHQGYTAIFLIALSIFISVIFFKKFIQGDHE